MNRSQLARIPTAFQGVDIVVEIDGDGREGAVWLVHEHPTNGTMQAELDLQAMLHLRATLGTLIRARQGKRS